MHCGTGGSVGGSVAGVVADSVADSVTGACVAGGSVAALDVVGVSVAGGSVTVVAAAEASVAARGVVGASVADDSVAIVTACSFASGAEEAIGVCCIGADCMVESGAESVFSPVAGCDVSPKRNAAVKTQTITTAAITAYCHFFILRGNGKASPPLARGSRCPADQGGCRRCR